MTLHVHNLDQQLGEAIESAVHPADDTDVLVVGTGPVVPTPFLDLTVEDWQVQIDAMQRACLDAVAAARNAIDGDRKARIVFVVHPPTVRAVAGATAPAVAGAFLSTFAQVGGIEMADRGVTTNVIVAGWTDATSPGDVVRAIPAGRYAKAEEIAGAVAYFASESAGYTTGACLTVDGGFVITKVGGGSPLLAHS